MKISFLRMTFLGALVFLFSACSGMQSSGEGSDDSAKADKPAFEQAYMAAESAYNRVKPTDNIWVATEENMEKAKEAAGKGDFAKAIKLANLAKHESDLAYEQYQSQKDIKPWQF